uniref:Uncharacterized protein MANES_06G073900 n=1 Tax=Rhizophora mucronata TaxID=61149 RepID=A0A2P2LVU4_RHIMU
MFVVQSSRAVTKFTEDFDFEAMNEKFKKDEVWDHLGKVSKPHSKDKEDGNVSDDDDSQDEVDGEYAKIEVKVIYFVCDSYAKFNAMRNF